MKYLLPFLFLTFFLMSGVTSVSAKEAVVLSVDGAISPAYADYLKRGITAAEQRGAEVIILELNTAGGLLSSTRKMVSDIITSKVPVVVYVTPSGSHAASAGTFILMAGHIAAMDEGTNVGAATPVQVNTAAQLGTDQQNMDEKIKDMIQSMQDPNSENMQKKALADTTAFIRAIAEMRGRNAEWAEKAVSEAKSITAREALKNNVIDIIAPSRQALLSQIDGREVTLKGSRTITLSTNDIEIVEKSPDFMTKVLAFLSDPNVAAILMMVGIYGLILEFYAPGTMVSGVTGVICLLLAFYAFSVLPVNGLGGMLLACGLIFMFAEIFIPSFGILGIAGLISMIIGFAILFDGSELMGIGLEWQVIGGIALSAILFMGIGFIYFVKSVINKELKTGPESMIGKQAKVMEWDRNEGFVFVNGERWQAFSPEGEDPYTKADNVLIGSVNGLKLKVRKPEDV